MGTLNVKDKIALVTGANRGIGEAFVKVLLEQGARKIYAAARDLDNLKPVIALAPDIIEPVLLDVTDTGHIQALPEKISALDILVNNAGIANACNSTSDNAVEISRLEMETNLFGPMQITLALLPQLKRSSEAAIINLSSIAGISNFPALGPYSATKAAMHSYTQGLRAELADTNIQVVGVYPGPIDTRMAEGFEMEKAKPEQVAIRTFIALGEGTNDVLPDDFAEQMYNVFLEHPHNLENAFSQMLH
ncbi:MAG TPA: SDR family NAD(P)-dependent oxidoreductase [Gammaproteobacteria bacterium]|nr:SDR family NAD(P)-dependent oxidoreductase [Gammaproteobacteria bacterium]